MAANLGRINIKSREKVVFDVLITRYNLVNVQGKTVKKKRK